MTAFVVTGHHSMPAARCLNVKATQAHVLEIDLDSDSPKNGEARLRGYGSFWACRSEAIKSFRSTVEKAA